ncbi:flagellar basal body L-ring protein FlgH [Thalassovita sp.]|uniref:flagellar basal body L-ring protein FlgH n=1 Tax=Thalassovita sp. TaxID=1979401 RepID=UPI002B273611|nr:flagellar basal body L-ring protein FlgH [Thalassovita sp.]
MNFHKVLVLLSVPAAMSVSGCSTEMEAAASADWEPVYAEPMQQPSSRMASGAIFSGGQMGLFATDRRAAQIGDILTVVLKEKFAASKAQGAATSKSDSFSVKLPTALVGGFDNASLSAGTDRSFDGSGRATQSNSLTGRMSVSVVRVMPSGNLEVMGQKKLTLNNGDEYVRLRGIVRQADITADNTVDSDRLANAEIKYVGAGDIADTSKKGWLRRGLDTVSPF